MTDECYKPREKSRFDEATDKAQQAINNSLLLLTAILGALSIGKEVLVFVTTPAAQPPQTASYLFYLRLGVMLAGLFTGGAWFYLTKYEMKNFLDWFDPRDYPPPNSIVILILGVCVALLVGGLMFFAGFPRIASSVFAVYALFDAFLALFAKREICRIVDKSIERLKDCREKSQALADRYMLFEQAVEILRHYHVQPFRFVAVAFVAGAAVTNAVFTCLLATKVTTNTLNYITGITIIALALFGVVESVLRFIVREQRLNKVSGKLPMRSDARTAA